MKDVIGGRYRIVRRLGSGGMASVYLAHDPMLTRDVAIKVPKLDGDGADEEAIERFQAELRAIGRLNHPNIVTIYDGGEDDGQPYLVMEPVDGESLAQLIRRQAPLPAADAVEIGRQVAEALAYAHNLGLIHRDVKPQNILLDRAGRAKVTDFGIVKSSDVTRTLAGTILGTPNFMAPEVSAGDRVTSQADIYALGVVLYQMLTGHAPFESDNPIATAVRSQREDPLPPSQLVPVPGWLDGVVLKALARNPAERYDSAAALAGDLAARQAPAGSDAWAAGPAGTDRRSRTASTAAAGAEAYRRTRQPVSSARRDSRPESRDPVPARRRRRTVAWLLPILIVAIAGAGIAYAATHTPGESALAGASAGASASAAGSGKPQANLLTNGALLSNGQQPAGWRLDVFQGRPPYRFWQPGGPAGTTKDREVGINSSTGADAAWVGTDVAAQPNEKLTLSGYVKAEAVAGDGPGAALHLVCHGADGKISGEAASPAAKGSSDWRQVQAKLTVPAGTTACAPELRLGAAGHPTTGTVEFSRIALVAG